MLPFHRSSLSLECVVILHDKIFVELNLVDETEAVTKSFRRVLNILIKKSIDILRLIINDCKQRRIVDDIYNKEKYISNELTLKM